MFNQPTFNSIRFMPYLEPLLARERRRFEKHQRRDARVARGREPMSFETWLKTLMRFEWKCAYCRRGPYQILYWRDRRQGLTQINCVPACQSCVDKMIHFQQRDEQIADVIFDDVEA